MDPIDPVNPIPPGRIDLCREHHHPNNPPNSAWFERPEQLDRITLDCIDGYKKNTSIQDIYATCDSSGDDPTWSLSTYSIPTNYCTSIGPPPDPGPSPSPGGGGGSSGGRGGGSSGSAGSSHDYNEQFTKPTQSQQTQELHEQYAIAFNDHTPISEINKQIYEYYKPKCSLHLDVDDQTLITNPGLLQLREYPGVGRCN